MIVKERNWNTPDRELFKKAIIADLFDKVGIALKQRMKKGEDISVNDKLIDSMIKRVDDYFINLASASSFASLLLPDRLKDANRFYIFTITPIPSGALLLSFVAKLKGDIDPVVLDLIY